MQQKNYGIELNEAGTAVDRKKVNFRKINIPCLTYGSLFKVFYSQIHTATNMAKSRERNAMSAKILSCEQL